MDYCFAAVKKHFQKRKTRFEIEVCGDGCTTANGGVLLIDRLARDLALRK